MRSTRPNVRHQRLQWKRVQQPADQDAGTDEPAKQARAERDLLFGIVSREHRKHHGDEEREDDHETEVTRHLRPLAMSNTSSTTSMLSSPAAMMNVLPYSYVIATTSPLPAPISLAMKYGPPTPRSAMAESATSGCVMSNGNRRPSSQSPHTNISVRATRKTIPF